MKFFCVCHYGHSRSAALAQVLHAQSHEAVCAGIGTSPSSLNPLSSWADKIIVLQEYMANHINPEFLHKTFIIDIGPDVWSNPYNKELKAMLLEKITRAGLL